MEVDEQELWADAQEMAYHLRVLTRRHERLPRRVLDQAADHVRRLAEDPPPSIDLDRSTLEWLAAHLRDTPVEVLFQDTAPSSCP